MSRQSRRDYEADVYYEVWRNGGDPDRIDFERVEDERYAGWTPDESASESSRRQRRRTSEEWEPVQEDPDCVDQSEFKSEVNDGDQRKR